MLTNGRRRKPERRRRRQASLTNGRGGKLKLVVSDFHLGTGPYREDGSVNVFEDFHADGRFAAFLDYHCQGEFEDREVELVINGDFFNLLTVDLDGRLADAITERLALEKTEASIQGHPVLFDALERFAGRPGRSVTFIMGNHDPGFLFPAVRHAVGRRVGGRHAFVLDAYDFDGVHIEHGQQREAMTAFNPQRYFNERDGELFLNLPLGSRFLLHVLNHEKAQRPYIDKVAPFRRYYRWALLNDPAGVLSLSARSARFYLAAMLRQLPHLDPLPVSELLRRLLEFTAFPTLEREAEHLLERSSHHTIIMGHTHIPLYREYGRDKVYVNTGTWNPMTSLDIGSLGRTEQLTYAHVEYVGGRPKARLREWRGLVRPTEDLFC